jgi:hypothetical protein
MSKEKGNKIETSSESYLTELEAVYIMGIGAAKADGKLEDSELATLKEVSEIFGEEKQLENAYEYFEAFEESDSAINLAIEVLGKNDPSAKVAAVLLMQKVLEVGGMNQEESAFYKRVTDKLSN